jgi:hypothetical protein
MKEMMRLVIPNPRKPHAKTGLAEYKSDTLPQRRRKEAKVTE